MNVFIKELRSSWRSVLYWGIGMLFLVYSGMQKYSAYASSGQNVNEIFKTFPKALAAIFGMAPNLDLTKAGDWFALLVVYVVVTLAIHASLLGAGILAKEERDKTAEFLYAKPISRATAVTAKLASALINVIVLNVFTTAVSIPIVASFNKGASPNKDIVLMMTGVLLVQLIFLTLGMVMAALVKRPRYAASAASGIMFVTFFISLYIDITDKAQWLKYITPFKYFDPRTISHTMKLDPGFIALSAVLIIAFVAATYLLYGNRDLSI